MRQFLIDCWTDVSRWSRAAFEWTLALQFALLAVILVWSGLSWLARARAPEPKPAPSKVNSLLAFGSAALLVGIAAVLGRGKGASPPPDEKSPKKKRPRG